MTSPIKQLLIDAHAKGWIPAAPDKEPPGTGYKYFYIHTFEPDYSSSTWFNSQNDFFRYENWGTFLNQKDRDAAREFIFKGIKHKKPTPTTRYNGFEIPDTALSLGHADKIHSLNNDQSVFLIDTNEKQGFREANIGYVPGFQFDRGLVYLLKNHALAKFNAMLGQKYNWREHEGEQDG